MFIPAGSTYGVQYGPDGARYLEIRHGKPSDRGYSFAEESSEKFRQVMWPSAASVVDDEGSGSEA
jgi:hypothetical protein